MTPVHIGVFTCFVYSGEKRDNVNLSKVNDIGQKLCQNNYYRHDYPFQLQLLPKKLSTDSYVPY